MKHDEFAFFNQQLAAMLREDIPLEGALRQLCAGMRKGPLRDELQRLEADLAGGAPLPDALSRRALPELYRRMVTIGVRGNDLPGVLLLLADHYHRHNTLWARLKGLLLYPLIVLVVALGLTLVLTLILKWFLAEVRGAPEVAYWIGRWRLFGQWSAEILIWFPPIALALGALAGVVAATLPACRARLRWRLPAFREASLAQLASAIALMLKNGATCPKPWPWRRRSRAIPRRPLPLPAGGGGWRPARANPRIGMRRIAPFRRCSCGWCSGAARTWRRASSRRRISTGRALPIASR